MPTWIALLRGVNVGGHGKLPMAELAAAIEAAGGSGVQTYIQSGNAVFGCKERSASRLATCITKEIRRRRGFEPAMALLDRAGLQRAVHRNPFKEAVSEPAHLHVGFLAATPRSPDMGALEKLRAGTERFVLDGAVLYLHLPAGAGKSKLAAGAGKAVGVPITQRNWRTVCALLEMASRPAAS